MKSFRLLGISSLAILSLSSSGCFKGMMENILTYKQECITDETAKKNMREEGWKYVKKEKYSDAEVAFLSINDLSSLEKLAAIFLEKDRPDPARDIYLKLEKEGYQIRSKEEVIKDLKEEGYLLK